MVVPDSSEAVKVALLVPDAQAGKVVGKGGACFQMLRAQGCDMTMQSTADTEQFRRADIKGMSGEHLAVGFTTIAGRLGKGEEHSLAVVLSQDMANTFEENGGENIILDQTGMAASLEWGWTTEEAERRVMLNGDGDMLAKCFRLLLKACGVAKVGAGKPVTKPRQMGTGSRLAAGATGMGAVGRPATASKPPPLVAPGAADGSMGGFTPPAGYTPPAARSAGGGAPAFVAPESFGGAGGGGAPAFVPPESFGGAAGGGAHAFVAPESFGGAAGSRGSAKTFTPPSGIGAGAGAVALSSVPGASGGITGRPDQEAELHLVASDAQVEQMAGWQGASLPSFAEQSGCRAISLAPTPDGLNQEVIMQGPIGSVLTAQQMLWQQLGQNGEEVPDDAQMVYVAPKGRVGAVVGKQGAGLRQVRELSGLEVKVHQDPAEGWGRCSFAGAVQSCLVAAELVHLLCIGKGGGKITADDLEFMSADAARPQTPQAGAGAAKGALGGHAGGGWDAKPKDPWAEAWGQAQSSWAEPQPAWKRPRTGPEGAKAAAPAAAFKTPAAQESAGAPVKIGLLVPQEEAGKVVGKGGQVFQLLRAMKCDLTMQQIPDADNNRRADLRGQSPDCLERGLELITGRLLSRQPLASLSLMVPSTCAETLESDGGQKLQQIRAATGVNVSLEWDASADVSERKVAMDGDPTKMGRALRLLLSP